jgi:hypothetical protein
MTFGTCYDERVSGRGRHRREPETFPARTRRPCGEDAAKIWIQGVTWTEAGAG